MSEKRYSLHDVTQSLRISPDTLYRWENQIPHLKPEHCAGARLYTSWEFDLVQHAHRLFHNYNQDFAGTRSALERWISKNPKPLPLVGEENEEDEVQESIKLVENDNLDADLNLESVTPHQNLDGQEAKIDQELDPIDLSPQISSKENQQVDLQNSGVSLQEHPFPQSNLTSNPLLDHPLDDLEGVSVIKQAGGKSRVIGRQEEDLFADLSDPFDLSPSPQGRSYEFDHGDSLSSTGRLVPSLIDMEKKHGVTGEFAQLGQRSHHKHPSNSDWLERSTAVDEPSFIKPSGTHYSALFGQDSLNEKGDQPIAAQGVQHFKSTPAFSQPKPESEVKAKKHC
jgi:DNA-binding transcriptional MerR regulator